MFNRSVFSSLALIVTDPSPCKNPIPPLLDFVEIVPPKSSKVPSFSIPGFLLPVAVNDPPFIRKFPRTNTPFLPVPAAVTAPPLIFKVPLLPTTMPPENEALFSPPSAVASIVPLSIVKLPSTAIPLDPSLLVPVVGEFLAVKEAGAVPSLIVALTFSLILRPTPPTPFPFPSNTLLPFNTISHVPRLNSRFCMVVAFVILN